MWFAHRRPDHELHNQPPDTVRKEKMKHCQSARDCNCYKESEDKNLERNYILNFLKKTLPEQREIKKTSKKGKNNKKKKESDKCKGKSETQKKRNNDSIKDSSKKTSSVTLKRNGIIPLNDGSGAYVFVSQTTTIKETPCTKEDKTRTLKQDDQKRKVISLFKFISTVKRKTHAFLLKRKSEKHAKKLVKAEKKSLDIPKDNVFVESVPNQDDFVEETLHEEEETKECDNDNDLETGRVSVCSSEYFTPEGESPEVFRRFPQLCEEVFEEIDEEFVNSEPVRVPVETIEQTLDSTVDREELRRRAQSGEPLYPNCDTSIWMRSCEQEILEPIKGITSGMIPVWLKGTLLRNGPGCQRVGDMTFKHLFDSMALIHRFAISNGEVTYQCRFLKSQTYLKNQAANRIVVNEFGTKAVPDPCKSIFQRVSALFDPGESLSDNAMISIYPFGDELYCFTESPTIHRIDPNTLETLERVNVARHVAVVNHTSHPHVVADGSVFNQAMSVQRGSPHYAIVKFPIETDDKRRNRRPGQMFERAELLTMVKARWPLHPSYMHTFGLSDRFYVIVEQPLTLFVPSMIKNQLVGQPMSSCFRYFKDEPTLMHVIERNSGKVHRTYLAEAFFYLHIVNQFEKDDHVIIDICCYSDPAMMDCMYYDSMKEINRNLDYARLFRGRPMRFVLPLSPDQSSPRNTSTNLVTLEDSSAVAFWRGKDVLVRPELLCNLGCETPRINYGQHLGKPYRYFYAISSDVDSDNPGMIIKVDTHTRSAKTWGEPGVFPSEAIFVPSPDPQDEDDGVLLSALIWGQGRETQVGMLVLDAKSLQELGRAVFQTPSPVPKCLHGWFSPDIN